MSKCTFQTTNVYNALLKLGPPRQWKPIKRQNWNNRFQHFQIQPIKCPVQNNEISTCLLTSDGYSRREELVWNWLSVSLFTARLTLHATNFIHSALLKCEGSAAGYSNSPLYYKPLSKDISRAFFKLQKYSNPAPGTLTTESVVIRPRIYIQVLPYWFNYQSMKRYIIIV